MERIGTLLACFAAGLMGATVATFAFGDRRTEAADSRGGEGTVERVTGTADLALSRRLDELIDRVAALELARPADRERAPAGEAHADSTDGASLEALVRRVEALERSAREAADRETLAQFLGSGDRDERLEIDEARAVILDGAASEAEKLRAWSALRSGGWDDATVHEMIALAQATADPDVRADVWRQADASDRHLALVQPLLDSLAHDTDAGVRSEAAETLANYVDEPGVRQALEHAAAHDADEGVREEATSSLR